jgi:hypothetical protein
MSDIASFIELGLRHILALGAFDHLLFLLALVAPYRWRDWRGLALVVSAFTVGHTTTLGLVATHRLLLPTPWIEFLIPLTIVAAAIRNLVGRGSGFRWTAPLLAGGFGLIHGAGFASSLQGLFGDEVVRPLFGFNLGLEIGQLVVVAALLAAVGLTDRIGRPIRGAFVRQAWVSAAAAAGGLVMAIGRMP